VIDPAFLDELGRFDASLKRTTTELRQGEQESPDVGEGLTFADYRQYVQGDDIRQVDWKLYARTEEYYIKQYEAERNLTVHVLVDASASMDFGEGDHNKFEYGAKLGLAFAYLLADEGNDFRISTFREGHERLDGGRSNQGELLRVIDLLNETTPQGSADVQAALEGYASRIDSRSMVVVASDFLADPDAVASGIGALAEHDLVLTQVLTPEELSPAVRGDAIFEDVESDDSRRTYFGERAAGRYRNRLDDHVEAVAQRARSLRATHKLVDTGSDFFDAFGSVWAEVG
jgi:uncharacterized protein (DUF58 family)